MRSQTCYSSHSLKSFSYVQQMGTKIIGKNGSVCLDSSYNANSDDVKILTLTQQNFKRFVIFP
jgi:hypothetical protein